MADEKGDCRVVKWGGKYAVQQLWNSRGELAWEFSSSPAETIEQARADATWLVARAAKVLLPPKTPEVIEIFSVAKAMDELRAREE